MNIGKMMKDLQKMQAKMQQDVDALEMEGSAGGGVVTARMNGKKDLLSLHLAPEAIVVASRHVEAWSKLRASGQPLPGGLCRPSQCQPQASAPTRAVSPCSWRPN